MDATTTPPTVRESLEAAYNEIESQSAPAPEITAAPEPETPDAESTTEGERARDAASGKFLPGSTAKTAAAQPGKAAKSATEPAATAATTETKPADAGAATATASAPVVAVDTVKAPQSLTALEREAFAKSDPVVQQALARREKEYARGIQEHAEVRKSHEAFKAAVAQFEGFFRAEGADPIKALPVMAQHFQAIRHGTPDQAGEAIANLIRNGRATVETIAAALDRQPSAQAQPTAQQYQDPRVDQLLSQLQQAQQQQQESSRQREITEFQSKNEFYGDVAGEVEKLVGAGFPRDRAYALVVKSNEEIQKIESQREAAKAALERAGAHQRAVNASTGLKSSPAAPVKGAQPKSWRDALEETWNKQHGR